MTEKEMSYEEKVQKLDEILTSDMPLNQFTDALKKMSSTLVEMKDPMFILPVKLEAIKELVVYMQTSFPNFNTEKFQKMIQQFKDNIVENAYNAIR